MSTVCKAMLLAYLALGATGCATFQKKPVKAAAPPPPAPAASATTDKPGPLYPPPLSQPPADTANSAPPPVQASTEVAPRPAPSRSASHAHKPSSANKSKGSAAKPPAAQQVASSGEAASPIGTLTTGAGEAGGQKRRETSDLINTTEQGLNGIKRSLSTEEQETAAQIRTFLKQAKEALKIDDVDGANTLATKAKVLLAELATP